MPRRAAARPLGAALRAGRIEWRKTEIAKRTGRQGQATGGGAVDGSFAAGVDPFADVQTPIGRPALHRRARQAVEAWRDVRDLALRRVANGAPADIPLGVGVLDGRAGAQILADTGRDDRLGGGGSRAVAPDLETPPRTLARRRRRR